MLRDLVERGADERLAAVLSGSSAGS